MSTSLETQSFVNRRVELEFFRKDIQTGDQKPNKVRILHAPSGVGKSALTGHLLSDLSSRHGIKVSVPQHLSEQRANGLYLRLLGRSINSTARALEENDLTLERFLKLMPSPKMRDMFLKDITEPFTGKYPLARTAQELYERFFSSGQYDVDTLLSDATGSQLVIVEEYLRYALRSLRPVLNVENAQDLDPISLEYLRSVLLELDTQYYLFEYTESDNCQVELDSLISTFQSSRTDVKVIPLAKLRLGDALKLLRRKPGALEAFIKRAYAESDGNLRPLVDLDVYFDIQGDSLRETFASADQLPHSLDVFTELNVDSLSGAEKLIIAVLAAHGGSAPWGHLRGLYEYTGSGVTIFDVEDLIEKLEHRRILVSTDEEVSFEQDRVLSLVRHRKALTKYLLLAFDYWRHYYEAALKSDTHFGQSRADQLIMLLRCYIELDREEKVLPLLEDLGRYALETRSTALLRRYLEEVLDALEESDAAESFVRSVQKAILRTYYFCGLFSDALRLLDGVGDFGPEYDEYRASLLVLCHSYEEALELVEAKLERDRRESLSHYLRLRLAQLSALRCLNRHQDCKELFMQLMADTSLTRCNEYGYLLRNAQIASLPEDQTIEIMERSIEFFQGREDGLEEARGRIAMTLELATLGRLDAAYIQLDRAEDLLRGHVAERHSLLNNRAALNIYKVRLGEETLAYLRAAKSSATDSFDRLIINMNLLIVCSLLRRFNDAETVASLVEGIVESGEPKDLEIRRIAHYNLALHYRHMGVRRLAEMHWKQAEEIDIDFWVDRWKQKLRKPGYRNPSYARAVEVPFEPTFLSYWTVGVPR